MKKIIGVSFALVVSAMSFAQSNDQIQNKNGVDIMPVSGEWGELVVTISVVTNLYLIGQQTPFLVNTCYPTIMLSVLN